ncbi:MAG: NPP1 family protein [Bacteroidales bacterium]|nr:NPP1 family protein [Bacteroidales bacterium]
MKTKNYYLIIAALFLLMLPVQFACNEEEEQLQQTCEFDPWIYDLNCNGQIDPDEIQAAMQDFIDKTINETEFKAFFDLWISLDNDTKENSEKAGFNTCSYDTNSSGAIEKNEVVVALNDYLLYQTITKEQAVQVLNLYFFGGNPCSTNPLTYLPTLTFDGKDYFDNGETTFPMSFRFNTSQDANSDGTKNVEDNLENSIRFKIGSSLYGTGRTGLSNRGPNNQKPAVYFHLSYEGVYTVYEYWYYYPDNDWVNDHEHDWEKVFVYVQGGTPKHILLSKHNNDEIKTWSDITKTGTHPVLGVEGGCHAFKTSGEDGVKITWEGKITKNNGNLDAGDGHTYAWTIYSNDAVSGVVGYTESPDEFYYGDPYYSLQSELGDEREAPWERTEWNSPPAP